MKTLKFRKDALKTLTSAESQLVAGGTTEITVTCPTYCDCPPTNDCSLACPTFNCPTSGCPTMDPGCGS